MSKEVLVLGAGMVGVCSAIHLAQRGMDVTLLDRRDPGEETSYGNSGLIQRESVQPYAFPRNFLSLMRVLFKQGAAVNYHASALPAIAPRLFAYWRNSHPQRHARLTESYASLITLCLDEHRQLITQSGAQQLVYGAGFYVAFRQAKQLDKALNDAKRMAERFALGMQALDSAALAQSEPNLKTAMAGSILWTDPLSIKHPGTLVKTYARYFQDLGGKIALGDANSLQAVGQAWQIKTSAGPQQFEHAVIALGPWSSDITSKFGYRIPMFVKRGYHQHFEKAQGPSRLFFDADQGYVLAPMCEGLRLTTGAEFAHRDAPATPVQLGKARLHAERLFKLGPASPKPVWIGARPCMVDMLPVIGPATQHKRLWFNFGHGHQGFTLGPISGRLLAEQMLGANTCVSPVPFLPARFA